MTNKPTVYALAFAIFLMLCSVLASARISPIGVIAETAKERRSSDPSSLALAAVFVADNGAPYNDADIEDAITACADAAAALDPDVLLNGCVIELLPETYVDVQFTWTQHMREFRGRSRTLSKMVGPAVPANDFTALQTDLLAPDCGNSEVNGGMILVPNDVAIAQGHTPYIHTYTGDGNKQNFTEDYDAGGTPTDGDEWLPCAHNGIRVGDQSAAQVDGLIIENVTLENFAQEAIVIEEATNFIIRDSEINNIGCVEGWTTAMECGTWSEFADDDNADGQTGLKWVGQGVEIGPFATGTVDNVDVDYSSKMGIQTVTGTSVNQANYPVVTISNSIVDHAAVTGISLVRSNNSTISGNTVSNTGRTGAVGNVGAGIAVSNSGIGTTITGNTISSTMNNGIGFYADCGARGQVGAVGPPFECGTLTLTNNIITGACTNTAVGINSGLEGAISIRQPNWSSPGEYSIGPLTLSGNTVDDTSACVSNVHVATYSDVTIDGTNTFTGSGTTYGFHAENADTITLAANALVGTGTGVGIDIDDTVTDCTVTGSKSGTWGGADSNECINRVDGASINDDSNENVSSSNAVWRTAQQAWETECSDTLSAGSLGCDTYPAGAGTLRFGGYNSSIANLYGVGDKVFWEIDFMRPCGKDWEAEYDAGANVYYTGTMKFSRFATADNALGDTDAANNGGHLEVHENWGTPAENSTPAGATWGIYKENGVGGYTWTTTDAYPDCGTWNNYRMEIVLDTAIGANGDSRMQFFVNDTEVLDRTDTPTLTSANDEVESAQFIIYYNGEVQTSESPLVGYYRNFEVSGTSAFFTHDPPGVPTSLTATAGNTEVDLTWTDAGGGGGTDEFVVEYRCDSDADASVTDELFVEHSRPATNSLTITGLTNGELCQFRVAAEDAVDDMSEFSTMDTATPVAAVAAAYRTIVVFGDTQDFMVGYRTGGATDARYLEFEEAIDWVIANKDTENIDFVLGAGDLIDNGTRSPTGKHGTLNTNTECDGENQGSGSDYIDSYTRSEASCISAGSASEAACEALDTSTTGCFWYDAGPGCHSCQNVYRQDVEWDQFEAQWDRFETAEIPAFVVKGNHDNAGTENANDVDRESLGFNNRYAESHWTGLETTSSGWDRVMTHEATYSDGDEGNGYLWTAQLRSTPAQTVVIGSVPYESDATAPGTSATALTWLETQLANFPTTPAIVLAHHKGEVTSLLDSSEEDAPNVFMSVSGHIGWASGGNRKAIVANTCVGCTDSIIEIETDYTNDLNPVPTGSIQEDTGGTQRSDYITLVRWYPDTGEIEVDDFSVQGDLFINDGSSGTGTLGASSQIAKVAFDIIPPTPYDLSPYDTEMNTVFGFTSSGWTWPTPPDIDPANDATVTDCITLDAELSRAQTHVTIPTGTSLSCTVAQMTITANDVWLEMQGTASLTATNSSDYPISGSRVKITGGEINVDFAREQDFGGGAGWTDVLIDNVVITAGNNFQPSLVTASTRVAVVNSDINTGDYGNFIQNGNGGSSHMMYANVNWDDVGGGGPQATSRMMDVSTVMIVDSRINNSATGGANHNVRFHSDVEDVLVIGNQLENDGASQEIVMCNSTDTGQNGDMDNIHIVENTIYESSTGNGVESQHGYTTSTSPSSFSNYYFSDNDVFGASGGSVNFVTYQNAVTGTLDTSGNTFTTYSSTPAFTGGADH